MPTTLQLKLTILWWLEFLLYSLSHTLMEFCEADLRGYYRRKTAVQVLAQPTHSLPRNSTVSKQQTHDLGGWRQPTSSNWKLGIAAKTNTNLFQPLTWRYLRFFPIWYFFFSLLFKFRLIPCLSHVGAFFSANQEPRWHHCGNTAEATCTTNPSSQFHKNNIHWTLSFSVSKTNLKLKYFHFVHFVEWEEWR